SAGRARQRTRQLLIASEIALATFVLVLGGLLARSYARLRHVDLGLNPTRVARGQLFDNLVRRVAGLGGVEQASLAYLVPTQANSDWTITVEGHPVSPGQDAPSPVPQVVSPGYFATLGIPLRKGRLLSASDDGRGGVNAVINETMARRVWPSEDPIGKRFYLGI